MSDPMDTTTPSDAIGSASATAPTKPSLRVLEGGSAGFSTRKDDLAYGPSLLGLGGGHEYAQGPPDSRLALDLDLEDLDHPDPGTTILSPIPLELPTPMPPQTMSLSEVSQSGASLSVPADTLSSTGISHAGEQMRLPPTQDEVTPLFSWKYEFSWEDSCLCFDGKPLELGKRHEDGYSKANPGSEIASSKSLASLSRSQSSPFASDEFMLFGLAGIGSFHDSAERWDLNELSQELEVASTVCSISSDSSRSDTIMLDTFDTDASDPGLSIEVDKRIDWIVDLLVDNYFRSYAPQRTQRRSSASRNRDADYALGGFSTKTQRSGRSVRGKQESRRRKTIDDGEDSGDGDSRDNGQGSFGGSMPSSTRRFACPFFKWKPEAYGKCMLRFKGISHVKDHVRRKHYFPYYCRKCHLLFSEWPIPDHACVPADPKVSFITRQKFEAFSKRAKTSQSHEEQWQHIYGILLPGEPLCSNPYLDAPLERKIRNAVEYFRSEYVKMVTHEEMTLMKFDDKSRARNHELIFERLIPRLVSTYYLNGQVQLNATHGGTQATELAQPSQTVDPREIDPCVPDEGSYSLQWNPDVNATAYPASALSNTPESMSGQPSIESIAGCALLNASAAEGVLAAHKSDDAEVDGDVAFGFSADEIFLPPLQEETYGTYGTEFNPAWNADDLMGECIEAVQD